MNQTSEKITKNQYCDDNMTNIVKDHHKEDGFKETIFFKIEMRELNEKHLDEAINTIKPLLANKKLIICNNVLVTYEKKAYVVTDINSVDDIVKHLKKDNTVLLYSPIVVDGVLKYNTKLL